MGIRFNFDALQDYNENIGCLKKAAMEFKARVNDVGFSVSSAKDVTQVEDGDETRRTYVISSMPGQQELARFIEDGKSSPPFLDLTLMAEFAKSSEGRDLAKEFEAIVGRQGGRKSEPPSRGVLS